MAASPRARTAVIPAFVSLFVSLLSSGGAFPQIHEIDLGDMAAGGDGTGIAPPDIIGIHPDNGAIESFFIDSPILVSDGMALQEVDDLVSTFIDSVFIIEAEEMPINSAGTKFTFPLEDLLSPPQTWGQILNNRIGGELTPIAIGGTEFKRGVGIHAAAGITYDLAEIRDVFGPDFPAEAVAFAGVGDSAFLDCRNMGWATVYLILSSDDDIIDSVSHRSTAGGELLSLSIPPEARYLTLAAGAGNGQFFCNSGTFGDALILPPPNSPRNLGAAAGDRRVDLSWDEPPPGPAFTGYAVYRDRAKIADLPVTQRTYADEGLEGGLERCYAVRATRRLESSADSNLACATPRDAGGRFIRGDCNQDGIADISDAVTLLGFLFLGEETPKCEEACNANGDAASDISDAVALLGFLFLGEPPPPAPGPERCGSDPEPGPLSCNQPQC